MNDDFEAFRTEGHRLIDWIARYLANPEPFPVLSRVRPGELRVALPARPPARPEPLAESLADFERLILPAVTHWNHPGFFAYFANSSTPPAVLGELLAAALNVNGMLWKTGPAATELEAVVLDWLRHATGLPPGLFGVIQDTASSATLVALAAAREAVPGLDVRRKGMVGQARLRMYASEHAHSSVEKAGIVLGIGQEGLRKIPVDSLFRMDVAALRRAVAEDRAAGLTPFAVTATVGTTSTTSIDPVPAIAEVAAASGLWLHVDAAYAGCAAVAPELRHVLDGCDRADSLVMNPHKWLFAPRGTGLIWAKAENWARLTPIIPTFSSPEPYDAWVRDEPPKGPTKADWITPGGFYAYEHQWAMPAAFHFHQQIGRKRIAERIDELNAFIKQGLAEIPDITVYTPNDPKLSAGIVSFRVKGKKNEGVLKHLLGQNILASISPYGIAYLRLAAGIMNTPAEVESALKALRSLK